MKKRLIIGATGASGIPILIQCLKLVQEQKDFESYLVMTDSAKLTLEHETKMKVEEVEKLADHVLDSREIGAGPASGSFQTEGMIIVPCSMKTIAGIHSGYADNLILRAADVTIKEQRPLVLVARETPLSVIHLRNLQELAMISNVRIIGTIWDRSKRISKMERIVESEVSMKILSFGSLNIDYVYKVSHFVKKGETLSAEELNVYTGGKGLNQSIALSRAGMETYHAGAIGMDGLFLLDQLKEAGVNTDLVKILEDIRTGNAIIQNDEEGDNCIILFGGANQAISKEQVDEVFEYFTNEDYLLIQNEINELPYIVEKAKETGMKIILNPSPMNEKIKELPLDQINYFLLNEIEAMQILDMEEPKEIDGKYISGLLHQKFPEATIVLTLGSEGSVCIAGDEYVEQSIYKVKTVDTTAAGDTYTGYFIAGILNGKTIKEAMDTASKASAIAVSRQGAAPSIPCLEEVEEYKN